MAIDHIQQSLELSCQSQEFLMRSEWFQLFLGISVHTISLFFLGRFPSNYDHDPNSHLLNVFQFPGNSDNFLSCVLFHFIFIQQIMCRCRDEGSPLKVALCNVIYFDLIFNYISMIFSLAWKYTHRRVG